jgi:2'-5' RNA ligase
MGLATGCSGELMRLDQVQYADCSSWQEWQHEYRYGAFYVFPPPDVIETIDRLRGIYDPQSAAYCQAHISLSEPLEHALHETELEELAARLALFSPFVLSYGPLRDFPPYPGVAYAIRPEERFRELQDLVHATTIFEGRPLKRHAIAPHMTIAEFISVERTKELLRELSGVVAEGNFVCDRIEYAVPDASFHFQRVLAIPLGSSA